MRCADVPLPTWSTDPAAAVRFSLDRSAGAIHSLVYASPLVVIDQFRAEPRHTLWRDVCVARSPMIVFARRAVEIHQDGGARFVASPVVASLYNRGQQYERSPIEEADFSDAFHFAPGLVREAIAAYDDSVHDREELFVNGAFPVSARTYLLQRSVFLYASRGAHADPLLIEEGAMAVLEACVAEAHRAWTTKRRRARAATENKRRDAVHTAQRLIAAEPTRLYSLDDLSEAVELSCFHLCRLFRSHTGMTIGEYLHRQRLRRSLEDLEHNDVELTTVALKHGYSSHSHYTSRFGREFDMTPSDVRRALVDARLLGLKQNCGSIDQRRRA